MLATALIDSQGIAILVALILIGGAIAKVILNKAPLQASNEILRDTISDYKTAAERVAEDKTYLENKKLELEQLIAKQKQEFLDASAEQKRLFDEAIAALTTKYVQAVERSKELEATLANLAVENNKLQSRVAELERANTVHPPRRGQTPKQGS